MRSGSWTSKQPSPMHCQQNYPAASAVLRACTSELQVARQQGREAQHRRHAAVLRQACTSTLQKHLAKCAALTNCQRAVVTNFHWVSVVRLRVRGNELAHAEVRCAQSPPSSKLAFHGHHDDRIAAMDTGALAACFGVTWSLWWCRARRCGQAWTYTGENEAEQSPAVAC